MVCERSSMFVNILLHTQVEDSITMVCEQSSVFVNILLHTQVVHVCYKANSDVCHTAAILDAAHRSVQSSV